MYVIPRTFLQCLCFEYENQTPAAILVALAKFPFFIVWERTPKFLPKRTDPLPGPPPPPPPPPKKRTPPPPPPPPQKKKAHLYDNQKEMQCSVSRLLSFSSGRIPRILRPLTTTGQHEKSQKSRTAIHPFFFFFLPHKCKVVPFSFRYFVLVFHVNDFALLNHSINRPLCPKFLNSLS